MLRSGLVIGALLAFPSLVAAQQPCTADARQVVNEIYRHTLERAADPASNGWVEKLAGGGTTVRDLVREIAKSAEHVQRFGSGAGAVDTLYRHILGRQPDAAGQRTYAGIAASRGLAAVVDQIIGSAEYQQAFGDWGVPGSGGMTYCARGAANTQSRTQPDRSQPERSQPERGQADRSQTDRGQADRGQADRGQVDQNPANRNPADRNQADRNAPDRGQADRNQADRNPADRNQADRGQGDGSQGDRSQADRSQPVRNPSDHDRVGAGGIKADRFEYLDRNGDHAIARNEWDGGRDVFDRLDTNRNGRLERNELDAGFTIRASNFRSLDLNRDRRLTVNEWPWSRRSFEREDLNNDGAITRDEFGSDSAAPTARRF